jgi:dihydroxy-acid dehydratase
LHLDCMTVAGETLGARLGRGVPFVDRGVIRSRSAPITPVGGLWPCSAAWRPGGPF